MAGVLSPPQPQRWSMPLHFLCHISASLSAAGREPAGLQKQGQDSLPCFDLLRHRHNLQCGSDDGRLKDWRHLSAKPLVMASPCSVFGPRPARYFAVGSVVATLAAYVYVGWSVYSPRYSSVGRNAKSSILWSRGDRLAYESRPHSISRYERTSFDKDWLASRRETAKNDGEISSRTDTWGHSNSSMRNR